MKRAHLIEWGIIVIALIFGYKFFQSILSILVQLLYMWDSYGVAKEVIRYLVVIGLYFAAFIILIRNSGKIALYLSRDDAAENGMDIKVGKRPLLQVILIAICVSAIVFNLADIIYYLFDSFKAEIDTRNLLEDPVRYTRSKYSFITGIIEMVIAIILIYFSKDISNLLIRKNEAEELVFDSKPKT